MPFLVHILTIIDTVCFYILEVRSNLLYKLGHYRRQLKEELSLKVCSAIIIVISEDIVTPSSIIQNKLILK